MQRMLTWPLFMADAAAQKDVLAKLTVKFYQDRGTMITDVVRSRSETGTIFVAISICSVSVAGCLWIGS
jgi:hypothetical protein